jgi:hypothetical protein
MNRWTASTVAHYLLQRDAEAVPRAELARLRRIERAARDVVLSGLEGDEAMALGRLAMGPEDGVIAARRQMAGRTPLQMALEDLDECRVARNRAQAQARDRLDRLDRIAERHGDDGYGFCSLCRDGLGNQIDFSCEDYRDATGAES